MTEKGKAPEVGEKGRSKWYNIVKIIHSQLREMVRKNKGCSSACHVRRDVENLFAITDIMVGRKQQKDPHPQRRETDATQERQETDATRSPSSHSHTKGMIQEQSKGAKKEE